MTYSKIVSLRPLKPRPKARPGSVRYEVTLECGHITWKPKSELERDGKKTERLLCRECRAEAARNGHDHTPFLPGSAT